MKQATEETSENIMHHHDIMEKIAKPCLSNPELKLGIIFPAVYFVNTNLPEERAQVLLPDKEHSELPDDSPNIFKKSNVGCYMERPDATFCNGKCSVLNNFSYAEFLAYYTLENKSCKT